MKKSQIIKMIEQGVSPDDLLPQLNLRDLSIIQLRKQRTPFKVIQSTLRVSPNQITFINKYFTDIISAITEGINEPTINPESTTKPTTKREPIVSAIKQESNEPSTKQESTESIIRQETNEPTTSQETNESTTTIPPTFQEEITLQPHSKNQPEIENKKPPSGKALFKNQHTEGAKGMTGEKDNMDGTLRGAEERKRQTPQDITTFNEGGFSSENKKRSLQEAKKRIRNPLIKHLNRLRGR